jgi:short-subunit dehydrogenase
VDVRDTELLAQQILAFDAEHPVDLLVVNAGIAHTLPERRGFESWDQLKDTLDVNLYGALASLHPLLDPMRQRGQGQILLVSSLSAHIGMPISPAYSASKAGLKIYGEALRGAMADTGVGVTVACPGFIRSPMSDRFPGPKPFLLTPEQAAKQLRQAAEQNRARVSFPFPLSLGVWFLSLLPSSWNLALQRLFRF